MTEPVFPIHRATGRLLPAGDNVVAPPVLMLVTGDVHMHTQGSPAHDHAEPPPPTENEHQLVLARRSTLSVWFPSLRAGRHRASRCRRGRRVE